MLLLNNLLEPGNRRRARSSSFWLPVQCLAQPIPQHAVFHIHTTRPPVAGRSSKLTRRKGVTIRPIVCDQHSLLTSHRKGQTFVSAFSYSVVKG